MGKPNKLTYMVPGKSIGATVHKGLADTFNWLVNFCNNLKGDDASITIDNELGDWPTIRSTSMNVEGGGGEPSDGVTSLTGNTDDSEEAKGDLTFEADPYSNIEIKTDNDGKTITIGVFYS